MFGNFFKQFDLFVSLPILRVRGDSNFASVIGGFFSLLFLLFFIYIFIVKLIELIELRNIFSMELTEYNRPQDSILYDQTVAIGIFGANILQMGPFLNVVADLVSTNGTQHSIPMRPCLRDDWIQLSDEVFNAFRILECFCPTDRKLLNQTGYFSSQMFSASAFHIYQCSSQTYQGYCAPRPMLQSIFRTQFNYLVGKFLVLNTAFNPNEENPISYFVNEKFIWLPLTLQFSVKVFMTIGTWQVETDKNFLPWTDIEIRKGYFVDEYIIFTAQGNDIPTILDLYMVNSRKNKKIIRQFGKIDNLLSYVGGLFGILIGLFAFFMISYNKYRYELEVSSSSFTFKKGISVQANQFSIFKYCVYSVYDWIKILTCCKPKWKQCRVIDETRSEAIQQIQVSYLLKRIAYIENVVKTLVRKEDRTSIYLIQPQSIEQIKQNRRYANYYSTVTEGETQTTIESKKMTQHIIYAENLKETQKSFIPQLTNVQMKNKSQENLTSLELIEKYLKNQYQLKKELKLSQDEQKIEEELSKDFYTMKQITRIQIVEKIPLPILYRLRERRNKDKQQQIQRDSIKESQTNYQLNVKIQNNNQPNSMLSILKYPNLSKKKLKKLDFQSKKKKAFFFNSSFYCSSEMQSCQEKEQQ